MRHVPTEYRIAREAAWYEGNHNIHVAAIFRALVKGSGVDRRRKDTEKARCAVIGSFKQIN